MTQARRMHNGITDEQRDQIRREVLQDVAAVFDTTDSFDEVRDKFDIRDPAPLSYDDVAQMTEEQINADWARVSEVMERGPDPTPPAPDDSDDLPPAARRPTGQQLINEHAGGSLTLDAIKQMSAAEINANWAEVQKVMEGGR